MHGSRGITRKKPKKKSQKDLTVHQWNCTPNWILEQDITRRQRSKHQPIVIPNEHQMDSTSEVGAILFSAEHFPR